MDIKDNQNRQLFNGKPMDENNNPFGVIFNSMISSLEHLLAKMRANDLKNNMKHDKTQLPKF
jgi:hypothetical protein